MAEPINIQVDPVHLREQIKAVLNDEFVTFSWRLRQAADSFDPNFGEEQRKWIEAEVEDRVAQALGGNK